ncbi:MAG: hypothetical protein QNJ26_15490 [Desulfobacterales bacterium]|nr:hypothetical protein [Desulfobacterales bacterium]
MPTRCNNCQRKIKADDEHHHQSKILCEECWMAVRATRPRKTHWLYLKSIKTDYLISAKKGHK